MSEPTLNTLFLCVVKRLLAFLPARLEELCIVVVLSWHQW